MTKPRLVLPICAVTASINGSRYGARDTIWAGFRWYTAEVRNWSDDHHLGVRWCHIDNDMPDDSCGIYRLRPLDDAYRFTRARNGMWVLQRKAE